jgi:hypothetical protein
MLAEADWEIFNRACFNYPALGDLYKYATYDAILKHVGIVKSDLESLQLMWASQYKDRHRKQ